MSAYPPTRPAPAGWVGGLTALPLPTDSAQLRTTGPYARVRHPIYTGVMLAALDRAAATASPTRLPAAGALVGLLDAKATWEEHHPRIRFPGYPAYAGRTAKFLPTLRRETGGILAGRRG